MRRLSLFLLALCLVACRDVDTIDSRPAVRSWPRQTEFDAVPALQQWQAVMVWNNVVAWNEAVAENQRREDAIRRVASGAERRSPASRGRSAPSAPNNRYGPHTDAWWHGVAICEQGGRNDPFYGYFSIMDGSAGGLDLGAQVAMANRIISKYGDGAWAASCVAMGYRASPGG